MDVHGSAGALDWIAAAGAEYSAVIVGGDLERMGSNGFASKFLTRALSTGRHVYYVPGNAERPDAEVPDGVISLHGERASLGGRAVGGLGGSNLTPFRTPFELNDEEARGILSALGEVEILVSHCPPRDTQCDLASGRHIGSTPVREYVGAHHPKLVLCGHAHESRAVDAVGGTTIANPGPLAEGNFAVVELGQRIKVELKSGAL